MDKISQLMDGELSRRECKVQIERLRSDPELSRSWETYHLIGDVLRGESSSSPGFASRLRHELGREPVVLAPHLRFTHRVVRYTLPLAAGIAGVTLVAWLSLSFQQEPGAGQQGAMVAQLKPVVSSSVKALPINRGMDDYLMAHQEFSPTAAMQGVASYVRTVSSDEPNAR